MKLIYHPSELEKRTRDLEIAEIGLFVKQEELKEKSKKLKSLQVQIRVVQLVCTLAGFFAGFFFGYLI